MPCSLHAVAIEARVKGNSQPIPSKGREHCAWQHGRSAKAEAPAFFEKKQLTIIHDELSAHSSGTHLLAAVYAVCKLYQGISTSKK